jgi:hypothetical protein
LTSQERLRIRWITARRNTMGKKYYSVKCRNGDEQYYHRQHKAHDELLQKNFVLAAMAKYAEAHNITTNMVRTTHIEQGLGDWHYGSIEI